MLSIRRATRFREAGARGPEVSKNPPKAVGWLFTIAMEVDPEVLPPGSTGRTIWQEHGAPPLEIEIAETAGQSHRVLSLRAMMPFEERSLGREFQRKVAARMLRKATEIFPFLEFHSTGLFPDFREEEPGTPGTDAQPSDLALVHPYAKLQEIPVHLALPRWPRSRTTYGNRRALYSDKRSLSGVRHAGPGGCGARVRGMGPRIARDLPARSHDKILFFIPCRCPRKITVESSAWCSGSRAG